MKYAPMWLISLCMFTGCTIQADRQASEPAVTPAIIEIPSKEITAELQRVIARLLKQEKILLSARAFTTGSVLTLERWAHQTVEGAVINGRARGRPLQVELIRQGRQCLVRNTESGEQRPLSSVVCREQPLKE